MYFVRVCLVCVLKTLYHHFCIHVLSFYNFYLHLNHKLKADDCLRSSYLLPDVQINTVKFGYYLKFFSITFKSIQSPFDLNHKYQQFVEFSVNIPPVFFRKEYMMPTLELESNSGAILADDDPLSLLFPMGTTHSEQLRAKIIKWSVPPLVERYREACRDMTIGCPLVYLSTFNDTLITDAERDVCKILEELSIALNLTNRWSNCRTLEPLCKALNKQSNLLELDLSGNCLSIDCVKYLASSLPSVSNLHKLNLSCTVLRPTHLQVLSNSLQGSDVIFKVETLDLSCNFLEDQNLTDLSIITKKFKLRELNLSNNLFSKDMFQHSFNQHETLSIEYVENIDLSGNKFSNDAIIKILSWLKRDNIKHINVSKNLVLGGFLQDLLSIWSTTDNAVLNLKTLGLSHCHIHDGEVFDLLGYG